MKITAIILFAFSVTVSARGVAQTVSIHVKDAPLKTVFKEIEKQSGYQFFYNDKILTEAKNVTIQVSSATLDEVLILCFSNQPLTFSIVDKTIIVKARSTADHPSIEFSPTVTIPPIDVHGRVLNEDGEPVEGAAVKVKGTNIGTSTNSNGEFSLKGIAENSVLVFSGVNIETTEIKVGGKTDLAVSVKNKVTSLQDVVIDKGYYSEKRWLSTGDVSTVTGKEIREQPLTDPILTLEGKVPGLYISQTSGVPGAYSKIQIMGQNSLLNGNDPLYIIDGVPYDAETPSGPFAPNGPFNLPLQNGQNQFGAGLSPFNMLDPSTIENIEVLKDADATAIYGSRGANGVVLITTKKGKAGDTRVSFNFSQGVGKVTNMMPMMNSPQYLHMRYQALKNDGVAFPSIQTNPYDNNYDIDGAWDTTRYTDWQKLLIGNTAHYTNANLNLSGGNTTTQFVLGGSFSREGTPFIGDYSDNKSSGFVTVNHHSLQNRFSAQLSIRYLYDYNNEPPLDLTGTALTVPPDAPALYNADGTLNWGFVNGNPTFQSNPLAQEQQSFSVKTNNLVTSLKLGYELFPGLKAEATMGYNNMVSTQVTLTPSTFYAPGTYSSTSLSNFTGENKSNSWSIEPQLSYSRRISRGNFNLLVGTSFQSQAHTDIAYNAKGFTNDAQIINPAVASSLSFSNYVSLYRYNAVYGRIGYTWDDKYIINATARRDGSSRFGPGKQWGDFGSVGVGWIFSRTSFIQNHLSWLSFAKLRASYGITGNDEIGDYQYLSTYNGSSTAYQGQTIVSPTALTNPFYSWEHVKKLQGGLDLGLFKNRIQLSATYYQNRDNDQLVGYTLPNITGFGSVQANSPADVQNNGWEMTVSSQNIKANDLQWNTDFNITLPQNKLLSFPNIQYSPYYLTWGVGQSLSSGFVYHYTGISPQTGLYTFSTQNANGIPGINDLVLSKPVTQTAYGALTNTLIYKGFELDIMFQFVRQLGYNYLRLNGLQPGGIMTNQPTYFLNAWQHPGDQSNVGRYFEDFATDYNAFSHLAGSDAAISDASFIRLRNLSLSYNLSNTLDKKLTFQSARIYIQAENLLTITSYKGMDPETQNGSLPPLRMIAVGIQGTF